MSVQRLTIEPESSRSAVQLIDRHVTSFLDGRRAYHDKVARNLARLNAPLVASLRNDPATTASIEELKILAADEKSRLVEKIKQPYRQRQREYFVSAHSGINVDVPPYDVAWQSSP